MCDHIDEAADNIDLYEVKDVSARAQEQADVLYRAASRLHEAVELLEGHGDSQKQLHALRELEDEGDRLSREAIADLFRTEQDPLTIIRWKDIHEPTRGGGRRLRERGRRARGHPRQERADP